MTCLHTGAVVYLIEYGQAVKCDIHEEGNHQSRILNLAGGWENVGFNADKNKCDYAAFIGKGYFNKPKGVIVIPYNNIAALK